jgi:hypothetical protein
MFYTVVKMTLWTPVGNTWADTEGIIPKTPKNPDLMNQWMKTNWQKLTKLLYQLTKLNKGGFIYAPDLFKNVKIKYNPYKGKDKKGLSYYQIISDIYFEDTYNEGPNKMINYIKKTGILSFPETFRIEKKYTTL